MAVRKDIPLQGLPRLDPAVDAVRSQATDQTGLMQTEVKSKNQEKKPWQLKKAENDRKRNRSTFDLPNELIRALESLAKKEGISISHLATALLIAGLEEYVNNRLKLRKRITRSTTHDWGLEFPKVPEVEK